ncbi:hypothetical protein D039_0300A, partial [Vibrio parahaemolyticus EKP-028]|jgi:hypothetical protein
MVPV